METFRFRLGFVDLYQAEPSHLDPPLPLAYEGIPNNKRPRVPVLRVFGSTDTGQKVCAHIHGAFPYIYIDYDGNLDPDEGAIVANKKPYLVAAAQRSLHQSIDDTLASSFRHERRSRSAAFVAHISLVKGIPFYGYHVGYRLYFKIYLLNPSYTLRLAELLRRGAILGRRSQPYESHLQYRSQWMIDYNLYGCAYINCKKACFRAPLPPHDTTKAGTRWTDRSIPSNLVLDPVSSPRQSYCELEVDIQVQDILNRHEIKERPVHYDIDERNTAAAFDEKLVPSLASLWHEEAKRRRGLAAGVPTVSPFSTSELVPMSAGQRSEAGGKWIHEDEYRTQLHDRIVGHLGPLGQPSLSLFRETIRPAPFFDTVETVFASVAELHPSNISSQKSSYGISAVTEDLQEEIDQDEALPSWILDQNYKTADETEEAMHTYIPEDTGNHANDADNLKLDSQYGNPKRPWKRSDNRRATDMAQSYGSHCWRSSSIRLYPTQEVLSIEKLRNMGVYRVDDPVDASDGFLKHYVQRQEHDFLAPEPSKFITDIATSPGSTQSKPSKQPHHISSSRPAINGKIPFTVSKGVSNPRKLPKGDTKESLPSDYEPLSPSSQHTQMEAASDADDAQSYSTITGPTSTGINSAVAEYAHAVTHSFNTPKAEKSVIYAPRLPSVHEVLATVSENSQPSVIYQDPFYSNEDDVPDYRREYAGKDLCRETNSVYNLPPFDMKGPPDPAQGVKYLDPHFDEALELASEDMRKQCTIRVWEFMPTLPTRDEVVSFFQVPPSRPKRVRPPKMIAKKPADPAQPVENASSSSEEPAPPHEYDRLRLFHAEGETIMSLEVHVNTRHHFVPDPIEDEIQCIFLAIQHIDSLEEDDEIMLIVISLSNRIQRSMLPQMNHVLFEEASELDVITKLVDVVRLIDPDILTGYEIHGSSWGYIIERGREHYDYNLCDEISR
ncbi:DNA polymerase zeta, partial [Ascosphaera pollenicola]